MLQLEENSRIDLLSFENLADVRRIKSINDEQLIAEDSAATAVRQAKDPSQTTKLQ